MNGPDPPARPSERLVRTALLSARLFVDSLEKNSVLRYGGLGLMDPVTALDVLARDAAPAPQGIRRAQGQTPERPHLPVQSRARLVSAVKDALTSQQEAIAEAAAKFPGLALDESQNTLLARLRRGAAQLAAAVSDEVGEGPDKKAIKALIGDERDQAASGGVAASVGPQGFASSGPNYRKPPLQYSRHWHTTVVPTPGPATRIVSEIEVKADLNTVAMLCDPRRWSERSLFWLVTERLGHKDQLPDLDDPDERRKSTPESWSGLLHEEVAGIAIFAVDLHIDYKVSETSCTVDYKYHWSPDTIKKDDGTLTIEPIKDDPGWLYARVTKDIDFEDAPFGGPSSGDILAPSFFASWMRIQQDVWASRIAEFAAQDAAGGKAP